MLNKKLLSVIISIMLSALACGQFEISIESKPTTLVGPQTNTITAQEKPDSNLLSDQNNNSKEEDLKDIIQFMAYTDTNLNVWVLEIGSGAPRQITNDAALFDGTNISIEYSSPQISSDGTLLVYRKSTGAPVDHGIDITDEVWVENMISGEKSQVLSDRTIGFSWKPETHELAYTTAILDMDYWISRGETDPDLATGISLLNLDSLETVELVQPERGFTLASPRWTDDGMFVYFTEIVAMEGSGMFAYYDLENEEYIAWEEPVGKVSWSSDGELITYARHTYAANGEERIYLRTRQGSEQLIGPEYEGDAYATWPTFSPNENKIAYIVYFDGPMTSAATIMVLDLEGGEPRSLGNFEDVWELDWTLDGKNLIFSSGNWESRQIVLVNLLDGSQSVIAEGSQLSLSGQ